MVAVVHGTVNRHQEQSLLHIPRFLFHRGISGEVWRAACLDAGERSVTGSAHEQRGPLPHVPPRPGAGPARRMPRGLHPHRNHRVARPPEPARSRQPAGGGACPAVRAEGRRARVSSIVLRGKPQRITHGGQRGRSRGHCPGNGPAAGQLPAGPPAVQPDRAGPELPAAAPAHPCGGRDAGLPAGRAGGRALPAHRPCPFRGPALQQAALQQVPRDAGVGLRRLPRWSGTRTRTPETTPPGGRPPTCLRCIPQTVDLGQLPPKGGKLVGIMGTMAPQDCDG